MSAGNENDITKAEELTKEIYDCYVIEDKGYDSDVNRKMLESRNNIPVIPGRISRKIEIKYDTKLYKKRNLIERIFGKIKENRRLAVRFEKSDMIFLAFITIAFLKINLC